MRRWTRYVFLSLCGLIALLVAIVNPLYTLLAVVFLASVLVMIRQLNMYRVVMMLKRLISNVSRLRLEIRARVRTGFRDYSSTAVENEESNLKNSHCGYMR